MKEDSNPNCGLYFFFPFLPTGRVIDSPNSKPHQKTKKQKKKTNNNNHHPNHKNGRKDIVTSDQSKGKLAPQLQRSRNPTPPMPPHSTLKRLPAPIQPNDRLGSFPSPPLPNRAVCLQSPSEWIRKGSRIPDFVVVALLLFLLLLVGLLFCSSFSSSLQFKNFQARLFCGKRWPLGDPRYCAVAKRSSLHFAWFSIWPYFDGTI